jgi:hypothetical protein
LLKNPSKIRVTCMGCALGTELLTGLFGAADTLIVGSTGFFRKPYLIVFQSAFRTPRRWVSLAMVTLAMVTQAMV